MIRTIDALTLAYTKLRTRRIRTIVTVIIASLLFGVLALATLLLQGSVNSIGKFSSGSLSDRYLASATYASKNASFIDDTLPPNIKVRATAIYNQTVEAKKAAAKTLGIEYDPTTEQKPLTKFVGGREILDSSSPSAVRAFNEYLAALPSAKEELDKIIALYHPSHIYPVTGSTIRGGQVKPLTKTGEDFTKSATYPNSGSADISFGWQYVDQSVTQPFMLSKSQLDKQNNTRDIPVVAPVSKVEEALGLKRLPNAASAQEKLDRIQYIRNHAEAATFSICYRNSVSQSQIDSAISVAKEIEDNKGNKEYKKPSLIYQLPAANSCSAAIVAQDTRTAAEKTLADKQDQFRRMFGGETTPAQQKITFRAVGLSPNGLSAESFSGIGGLLTAIAGSTLEGQWVVPQQMYDAMPGKQDFAQFLPSAPKSPDYVNYDSSRMIIEFDNASQVKAFVTKTGCGSAYCDGTTSATFIEDIRNQVVQFLIYAALAIGFIASIIMMGMIGRVIGDSRRETAVFRAIGAKRNDIRLIYLSYTIMLSKIILLVSLVLGAGLAWWIDAKIAPDINVQAHLVYIFADDTIAFRLIGIWWQALAALVGLVILAGIIGMLLPLARNLARNPIKDMRDDT
jgi:hypothetical protein